MNCPKCNSTNWSKNGFINREHNVTNVKSVAMIIDSFKNPPPGFKTLSKNGFSAVTIPELSHKYCKNCGCSLPYKTRQNLQTCPNGNNNRFSNLVTNWQNTLFGGVSL